MLRANDNRDLYLRHAGIIGLAALADPLVLLVADDHPSTAVRLAALLALRRQGSDYTALFLKDKDPFIVLEAARSISDLPISPALPRLATLSADKTLLARAEVASLEQRAAVARSKKTKPEEEPDVLVQPLLRRIINAHFRLGGADNAAALVSMANTRTIPEAIRAEAVSVLADWAKPSGRDIVTGLWRPLEPRDGQIAARAVRDSLASLLQGESAAVKLAAVKVAASLGISQGADAAFALVADEKQRADVRLEALRALSSLNGSKLGEAVTLALSSDNRRLRSEATRIQARLKPADATAGLRAALDTGSTDEKQSAFATLATVSGDTADEIISQWLDKLLAKQLPAGLQLDLLEAAAKRSSPVIKEKLTKYERSRPADDDLRAWRECLEGGDAEEGKKIFLERAEVSCVRCHKAGGEGGEAGPDLARIGAAKTREYLLESIVYPNKHIAAGFESLLVTMNNGAIYGGLLKSETDTEMVLNSPEDGVLTLKKADIKERRGGLSGMPEELRQVLTKQDLRNLVEFLSGLK
jgi:quinoprotein glucose dehydrogenase